MRREQNTPAHRHKSVSSTSFQAGIERCRFPAHWSRLTLYRPAQPPPGSPAPSLSRLPNLSNPPAITSASADLSPHIALAFTLLPDQFPTLKSDKSRRDAVFSTHRPPTRYPPRAMSQPPPVPPELTPPPPGKISGTGRFLGLLLVVPLFALMVLLSGCWLSVWWLVHFNIPAAARPAAVIGPMFWS